MVNKDRYSEKFWKKLVKEDPERLKLILARSGIEWRDFDNLDSVISYILPEGREREVKESLIHRCQKCEGTRITMRERQTRSLDEPSTFFFTCIQCGNKWTN